MIKKRLNRVNNLLMMVGLAYVGLTPATAEALSLDRRLQLAVNRKDWPEAIHIIEHWIHAEPKSDFQDYLNQLIDLNQQDNPLIGESSETEIDISVGYNVIGSTRRCQSPARNSQDVSIGTLFTIWHNNEKVGQGFLSLEDPPPVVNPSPTTCYYRIQARLPERTTYTFRVGPDSTGVQFLLELLVPPQVYTFPPTFGSAESNFFP